MKMNKLFITALIFMCFSFFMFSDFNVSHAATENVKTKFEYSTHSDLIHALRNDQKLIAELNKTIKDKKDIKEKEDQILSYDLDNAFEICAILDGIILNKTYKEAKSIKNIMYGNGVIIPAYDGNNNIVSIYTSKKGDSYDTDFTILYGSEFRFCDPSYSEIEKCIKSTFKKSFKNVIIVSQFPDVNMQLIYFEDEDSNSYVIPFNGKFADRIGEMNIKEGKAYAEKKFMKAYENTYDDWTKEDIKKWNDENKDKLGGTPQLKIKKSASEAYKARISVKNEKNYNASNNNRTNYFKVIIPAVIVFFLITITAIILFKRKKDK